MKNFEELWSKTRDIMRSKTNNSDDFDEKYMKIEFNSNEDFLLKKTVEPRNMIIDVSFFV